ncbi:Rubredoxin [Nannocystis exedens]|uniref:Rubredoxin n=1 Tax=Nannocystis exedens TaxID=54 RepID=A0A1I2BM05_9BACT|nr:rubredoxin [Nannocystis exedens]SFE56260.1 Rubredoxin [Nannocystis exedens]
MYARVTVANAKRYRCLVCEHIYDPREGDPGTGIAPGTAFEDIPDDWYCPDCGATKADFEPIED